MLDHCALFHLLTNFISSWLNCECVEVVLNTVVLQRGRMQDLPKGEAAVSAQCEPIIGVGDRVPRRGWSEVWGQRS